MCGLVAVWDRGAPASGSACVRAMLALLAHRGPDGEGTWVHGDLVLGHRRLAILDLSEAAHQPQATPDGRFALAYNGEIYNYRELRAELESEGAQFTSTGDAQVLLIALARWGPRRTVERLNGMFAFAFFDAATQELWLARDRLGIKPLHVAAVGQRVLVASEIKAFLAHPAFEARADRHVVATVAARSRIDAPWTLFEGVETPPAGALWRITPSGIERGQWYEVLERLDVARLIRGRDRTSAEVLGELETRLRESVSLHLVSDVPVATMCSGGVDSSLVTAYVKEALPNLTAYVADVGGQESEAAMAQLAARHLGLPMEVVPVTREIWQRAWPEVIWMREGASCHASDSAHLTVARRCRADGIRVLLTGEGADELFGGYPWHGILRHRWSTRGWRRWFMSASRRRRREARESFAPLLDGPGRREGALRAHLCAGLQMSRELRGTEIWRRLDAVDHLGERAVAAQGLEDLYTHLGGILMRHDRAGMAASLEMRVPFLENGMIDLGLHLHPRFKHWRKGSKWALKQVARKVLPARLVDARKKGFPVPPDFYVGAARLLKGGRLGELLRWDRKLEDLLLPRIEEHPHMRYALLGLELWARLYLDRQSLDSVRDWLVAGLAPRTATSPR